MQTNKRREKEEREKTRQCETVWKPSFGSDTVSPFLSRLFFHAHFSFDCDYVPACPAIVLIETPRRAGKR